jgi:hypothetical protein
MVKDAIGSALDSLIEPFSWILLLISNAFTTPFLGVKSSLRMHKANLVIKLQHFALENRATVNSSYVSSMNKNNDSTKFVTWMQQCTKHFWGCIKDDM